MVSRPEAALAAETKQKRGKTPPRGMGSELKKPQSSSFYLDILNSELEYTVLEGITGFDTSQYDLGCGHCTIRNQIDGLRVTHAVNNHFQETVLYRAFRLMKKSSGMKI